MRIVDSHYRLLISHYSLLTFYFLLFTFTPPPMTQLTYEAIITISLPGHAQPLEARVHLMPHEAITTAEGQTKPLADCTLADLAQFADQLEADLWWQYGEHALRDLRQAHEGAGISVVLLADNPLERPWLAQALVLLPEEVAEDEPLGTSLVPAPEVAPLQPIIPETPPVELPEVEEIPIITGETEVEPDPAERIVVAETESIYEEPEAAVGTTKTPAPERAKIEYTGRVAGDRSPLHSTIPHACDILMNEECLRGMQTHANSSMTREVAGVLVGPHPEKQPDGRYFVHITDYIIAQHTKMQGASVTYTPESWRYVNDVMMARYPQEEAVIVGWYHTHPGFGIFLSNMDLFIHHNFFTQKWHIAFVLDPVGQRSGFFTWDRQQKEVLAYPFPWPYWAHKSW